MKDYKAMWERLKRNLLDTADSDLGYTEILLAVIIGMDNIEATTPETGE